MNGNALDDEAEVTIIIGSGDAGTSTISAASIEITIDQIVAITVQLRDAAGNRFTASGGTISLTTSLGQLTEVTDNNDGTYSAMLSSKQPGRAVITGSLNGQPLTDTEEVNIDLGEADPETTEIIAMPSSITTIESATITVLLKEPVNREFTGRCGNRRRWPGKCGGGRIHGAI